MRKKYKNHFNNLNEKYGKNIINNLYNIIDQEWKERYETTEIDINEFF